MVLLIVAPLLVSQPAEAAASCPAEQACVIVHLTGSLEGTQVVTLDDFASWRNDVSGATYDVKKFANVDPQPLIVPSGISINELLSHLGETGIPAGAVNFTSIPDPQGRISTLSGNDVSESPPFERALLPELDVIGSGYAIRYVRPMRNDSDINSPDVFQSDPNEALQLTIHLSGNLLTPTVHATRVKTTTATPVGFSVTFDQHPGTPLRYKWTFGDGTFGNGATPSHAWVDEGTYYVTVNVKGADSSLGQSAPVLITVGPKPPPQHHQPPGGHGNDPNHDNPNTGPNNNSNGHHAGDKPSDNPSPSGSGNGPRNGPHGTSKPGGGSQGDKPESPAPPASDKQVEGIAISGFKNAQTVASITPTATAPSARIAGLTDRRFVLPVVGLVACLVIALGALSEGAQSRRVRRSRLKP